MGFEEILKRYLFDHFHDCLAGRLTKGIVHNINGPIQILSMQMELFRLGLSQNLNSLKRLATSGNASDMPEKLYKNLSDMATRLDQMEEALQRIEQNVRIIGNRGGEGKDLEPRPLILATLIQEELEFWKGDLFFKHQVSVDLEMPEDPPIVYAREMALRDLVDGILGACVEHLKSCEHRSLSISLSKPVDDSMALSFTQSGLAFPVLGEVPEAQTDSEVEESSPDKRFSALSLILSQEKAKSMGWGFDVRPQEIIVSIKVPSSDTA